MRLIDADEFERRIKRYDTTDYADKALYNFAHNEMITMPTVCDIEQIKAEIEGDMLFYEEDNCNDKDTGFVMGLQHTLDIIDKYMGEKK